MNSDEKQALEAFAREYALPKAREGITLRELEQANIEQGYNLSDEAVSIAWLVRRALEGDTDAASLLLDYADGTAAIETAED